jgi:hypothetical protein
MTTDLGKFRATINRFAQELLIWAREIKDAEKERHIAILQRKLELAMKIDPRSTVEIFVQNVYPHAEFVLQDDDRYFLESDPSVLGIHPEMNELHNQVANWWPTLPEQQKNTTKRYLKLLLLQGCIAVRHEPTRQLINRYRDPGNPLVFS